ncbi:MULTISPECIES: CAP domain-containing protein [unclassified Streptomyces]|uniref:CAP domain-containing protein n=1 Tax=unclassified Streptomyces TaxID=2593676 RepID=UPI002E155858|nr:MULTISPECIES: CAP domain-containing protein [unclassified Streptomyces]WSR21260.1 CAP domain-containing protein [Streptomyces sp. NBC_01205]
MSTRTHRVRRLAVAACAAPLLFTGAASGAAAAAVPDTVRDSNAGEIVSLVNAERAKAGCPALTVNPKLTQAAQTHAEDMAENNLNGHTGSDGSNEGTRLDRVGYNWSSWGGNVSSGFPDSKAHVDGWLNSAPHKKAVLNCNFTETGVGVSGDRAVQMFARPM